MLEGERLDLAAGSNSSVAKPNMLSHSWDISPGEAIKLQRVLAAQLKIGHYQNIDEVKYLASCDVSFNRGEDRMFAAVAVFEINDLKLIDEAWAQDRVDFPYIPGLLSFREIPVLLQAFAKITRQVDLVICDGQGIAHPRRLGIASHLGLLLQKPAIGCAKSLLCGRHGDLADDKGATSPIYHRSDLIGYALRTKNRVKPVYVSPGHLSDHSFAIDLIAKTVSKYRLPDPIRYVHDLANEVRRASNGSSF